MYTVTPEAVSKAIAVCRKELTKDTVKGVSFALEVLEMVLGGTKEVEQPQTGIMAIQRQAGEPPPIKLPPDILDEYLNGPKEDR